MSHVALIAPNRIYELMVVEDDPDFRALLHHLLAADNRLDIAGETESAEDALELGGRICPSVIVLDHALAGPLTGIEAAPMLKAVAPHCKIVLVTNYDLADRAGREPAIDTVVRKDHFIDLLPTIQRLLGLDTDA